MSYFLNDNFLLQSDIAVVLYNDYAKDLPIIDYHNHLSPQQIAENKNFENITKVWLKGDHYKWRAMRAYGIDEDFITGNASDEDKFRKWGEVVPNTLRNPLFHWTHMELRNPFGINEYLNAASADRIFKETTEKLQQENFRPQSLLNNYNVEMLGTTDDPTDDLSFHQSIRQQNREIDVKPSFRPDKIFAISKGDSFRDYVRKLSEVSKVEISDLDTLLEALQKRVNFFNDMGCVASDHGLMYIPQPGKHSLKEINHVFFTVLLGDDEEAKGVEEGYTHYILTELCKMYYEKGWAQQFHLGALRNNNTIKLKEIGTDTGYDSIGDYPQAQALSAFLNNLENQQKLTKTILYNLNPADNAVFGSMTGNFQGEGIKGKIQFGSAWWFLDQLDGMEQQINTLSNLGLISTFIGMLTDSRSFLSFPRHEYFRRLLCNLFAEDIRKGLLPNDLKWVGRIISDICYHNAKSYFKS
ncbi:glucuronate isomerase [Elizabethkingia miricola]|uniref:glucuronate isomerase n=1 Tax=Elizabethkingia miricola TaxID=172045 RepID=UPI0038920755